MTEDEQVLHDELEKMIAQEVVAKALDDATRQAFEEEKRNIASQKRTAQATSINKLSTGRSSISTATTPYVSASSTPTSANAGESSFVYLGGKIPINASTLPNADLPIDLNMPDLEDDSDEFSNDGIFNGAYDDDNVGAVADFKNMDDTINVNPIPTLRIHKDHPKDQILGDPKSAFQTRGKIQKASSAQQALEVWILVDLPSGKKAIGTKWEEGIDYDEVFAPVARIEAIRLFLAFASYMGFTVYQIDVKSAFLYDTIKEEVYIYQPPGFVDPAYPKKSIRRGTIDKTLFIKKNKNDIMLVQVYVDDIIFGSTKKSMCTEFEDCMHKRFQMSSMGELTFFLGLQVKQQPDGIFISQDKYVADILKKFDFWSIRTATTPIESNKPLVKDEDGEDVDVHVYRSMIGSLMYLTASRPDIMFAVCACARFQVTPKASHLNAVKRIFRYLKHQPKLGLWYPRDSPFELEAFSDSDYGGASLDRKSTTGGCQFLGRRLISWQCKKQTIVANSTTEAEYVAAANCCGQVLWIQNQMMDYGFNFMNTRIHIDNESTISVIKNPVAHSRTKHIEIRFHFIRDCYEKRLIEVIKIHTDSNVADLLTKGFDVTRFNFLVCIKININVHQPPGFVDLAHSNKVYKVIKALYGLHQAPELGTATTPIESNKPLVKDEDGEDVDVHVYRSMIGSLMYLTASRPDIMFAVCACARFQVTPKASHLNAVKRIFRYLKHQPKLGLWYPRDSPFELEAFSDSDYGGASLDRKSTTGGCQFLGRRLISWQCKKQTIMANSTTEAEYVAAANCCGQVLWIQNQMMDYGFNFMNTRIHIDNESTISVIKNPVAHSRTKHIEIRFHFIRDCYEKRLIEVIKIHTDSNVADLLTKGFDVTRFNFLVVSIGMLNL
ncbi:putative ribonuclease H-like domain-containing protein [Tanacetum coccineum]